MAATNERTVAVFGGTGFLGRRVVRHLRKCEFSVRIASRHPDRGHRLFGLDDPQLQSVEANAPLGKALASKQERGRAKRASKQKHGTRDAAKAGKGPAGS